MAVSTMPVAAVERDPMLDDTGTRDDPRRIGEIYEDAKRIARKLCDKYGAGVKQVWWRELKAEYPNAPMITVAMMCRFDKKSPAHWGLRIAAAMVQSGQWQPPRQPNAPAARREVVARGTCGECAVFRSPDNGARGLCRVVDSVVLSHESCEQWTPRP